MPITIKSRICLDDVDYSVDLADEIRFEVGDDEDGIEQIHLLVKIRSDLASRLTMSEFRVAPSFARLTVADATDVTYRFQGFVAVESTPEDEHGMPVTLLVSAPGR